MNVELISYTDKAKELLIFSKKTRITMSGKAFEEVCAMSDEEKGKELKYVFGTIGSSWEFVDYTFMISDVTRAYTHQQVRSRVGVSFAQQAQRVVDMSNFEYLATGECIGDPDYHETMALIKEGYAKIIRKGTNPQDARGVLPTNIYTNILMKINLRALSNLLNIRMCFKAQGEYQKVARDMRRIVMEIHPWAEPILQVHCAQYGNCAFPNFTDCPVRPLIPVPDLVAIRELWEKSSFEQQSKEEKLS